MRIREMLLREDFYTILKDTIEYYYKTAAGKQVTLSYDKKEGKRLIINSELGFICAFPAPAGLRKFLLGEYNVRGGAVKHLAGKAVALGVSVFPQIGKCRYCYITPGALNGNSFIYPQNRSVRFFDYNNNTVDCAVKRGFTDRFFNNQLSFRKEYSYDFMIPLIDCGEGWFREPILSGHPLARTTDTALYEKGIADALNGVGRLSQDTCRDTDPHDYVSGLVSEIDKKLDDAVRIKGITAQKQARRMTDFAARSVCDAVIPVSMSHGDFQAGNIWVDNTGKTWIYDWETVGKRSVWYDPAVLNYSLRRAWGWSGFMRSENVEGALASDVNKTRSADEIRMIKGVVLLEDLLFYLDDMLELPGNWGAEIFDNIIKNMANAVLG